MTAPRKCELCGDPYLGHGNSKYCVYCRVELKIERDKETMRKQRAKKKPQIDYGDLA